MISACERREQNRTQKVPIWFCGSVSRHLTLPYHLPKGSSSLGLYTRFSPLTITKVLYKSQVLEAGTTRLLAQFLMILACPFSSHHLVPVFIIALALCSWKRSLLVYVGEGLKQPYKARREA